MDSLWIPMRRIIFFEILEHPCVLKLLCKALWLEPWIERLEDLAACLK